MALAQVAVAARLRVVPHPNRSPLMTTPPAVPRFTFVGGVPRSGTSLVQKILDLHSEVYAGPEMSILPEVMRTYWQLRSNIESGKIRMVLDLDRAREVYRDFVAALFSQRIEHERPSMISEKTPMNLLAFGALAEIFPDAKFVWVVRDPRDVVCSFRAVQTRARAAGASVPFGRSLYADVRLIRSYFRAGEAFVNEHANRVRVVHYEDLVVQPKAETESLCNFLDLEFQEEMLLTERPNDTSTAIDAPRATRGIYYDRAMFDRPIDAAGIGKWRSELGGATARMIAAGLGPERFATLARYNLQRVARPWNFLLRFSSPVARIRRATALTRASTAMAFASALT